MGLESVRELSAWMSDPSIPEAVVGRVFPIIGVNNSELSDDNWRYRAPAFFRGNNVRTKSDPLEDISNVAASVTVVVLWLLSW